MSGGTSVCRSYFFTDRQNPHGSDYRFGYFAFMNENGLPLHRATRILITGSTGFIGIHLLREIISNCSADIVCLVRAQDDVEAYQRLFSKLDFFSLDARDIQDRVSIVTGDLSKPNFGATQDKFDTLCEEIDFIFHVGASNNWLMPFEKLEPINVTGTARIIEFARRGKNKTLHHISSTAVFMSLDAIELGYLARIHPLSKYRRHVNGYFESKWAAELLVQKAFDEGLPGTIYRPSFVGGSLQSGYLPKADMGHHFLISCMEIGACPDLNLRIETVPVDILVKAILNLASRTDHARRDYNLCNPDGIPLHSLRDIVAEFGVHLKLLPYAEWLAALRAGLPSVSKQIVAMACRAVPGAEDGVFEHLSRAHFDPIDIDTHYALTGTGVKCPPVDWRMLASYMGLTAPARASASQ